METDAFLRGYAAGKAGTSWTAEYAMITQKKEKQAFMSGLLKGQQDNKRTLEDARNEEKQSSR